MKRQASEYGHFSEDGRSYVLHRNDTPMEWFNVHFSDVDQNVYYSLTSNLGNGPIFARNADGARATMFPGLERTIYLRDADTGEVWNAAGFPVNTKVENYACTYTLHDTTVTSEHNGVRVSQRYFVPQGAFYEICTVELKNKSREKKRVQVMPHVPVHVSAGGGMGDRPQRCRFHPEINGQFAIFPSPSRPSDLHNAFLVSSEPVDASLGNSIELFHGVYSASRPDIPPRFPRKHTPGFGYALCFFVQNQFDLEPGATAKVHYAMGTAESVDAVKPITKVIRDDARVGTLLRAVKREYRQLCRGVRVETGLPDVDAIMNVWIKKQMRSYLAFKNAYRDNLQIDMAYSMVDPKHALANALDVLSFQYIDGHVPHSCRPLNPQHYSDKPTWLLMTFPELIKETGDFSVLELPVPYLQKDGTHTREKKSVWEHLVRTMRHLELDVGANGLNIMHHADWNDGLDSLSGRGESTFTSLLFCTGLRAMAELADRIGDATVAREARDIYARLAARLNDVCWDGEWYNRGISAKGRAIGSRRNRQGKIFLNPQVWAVISGVASPTRARAILRQVDRRLETDIGMKLAHPTFSEYDPDIGTMSSNAPGVAENGVYLHASSFKLVADCLAGRGEDAWRLLMKILPDHPDNPVGRSRCTPFAVTNSYRNADNLRGLTGSQWRTGTAGWVYRAMIEYILGVRRSYDGLVIDPCLPRELKDVTVDRRFRGTNYRIRIDNAKGRCRGATRITVDGKRIQGNVLPLGKGARDVRVTV